jgi:hypothetical protein
MAMHNICVLPIKAPAEPEIVECSKRAFAVQKGKRIPTPL